MNGISSISQNLNSQIDRFNNVATNYENMNIAEAATEMSTSKAMVEVSLNVMKKNMDTQEEVMNMMTQSMSSNRLNEVY